MDERLKGKTYWVGIAGLTCGAALCLAIGLTFVPSGAGGCSFATCIIVSDIVRIEVAGTYSMRSCK
jgi:hypothetical protein